MKVRVWTEDRPEPEAFEIGKYSAEADGVYARVRGIDAVFVMEKSIIDDLTREKEDF